LTRHEYGSSGYLFREFKDIKSEYLEDAKYSASICTCRVYVEYNEVNQSHGVGRDNLAEGDFIEGIMVAFLIKTLARKAINILDLQ
jgi:hypothetical protein